MERFKMGWKDPHSRARSALSADVVLLTTSIFDNSGDGGSCGCHYSERSPAGSDAYAHGTGFYVAAVSERELDSVLDIAAEQQKLIAALLNRRKSVRISLEVHNQTTTGSVESANVVG